MALSPACAPCLERQLMARCAHCGTNKVRHDWSVRPCALGKRLAAKLCDRCDLMLNDLMLSFFRIKGASKLVRRYGRRRPDAA